MNVSQQKQQAYSHHLMNVSQHYELPHGTAISYQYTILLTNNKLPRFYTMYFYCTLNLPYPVPTLISQLKRSVLNYEINSKLNI